MFFPDPEEDGSWEEMYWWDVIHGLYSEWEADKQRGDSKTGAGPRKRGKAGRKKPKKQSERKPPSSG